MRIKYVNYPNAYINVRELMRETLPRPKHKSRFVSDGHEFIPILTEEAPLWD